MRWGMRLLPGRCAVRETLNTSSWLYMPDGKPREVKTHRGIVLGLGPSTSDAGWGCEVGDVVQYHFEHHQEASTLVWPDDGKPCTYLPQRCVDAVIEP